MSKTDMLFYRAIYCVIGAISFFGCQDKSIIASFMINYLEIEVIEIPITHFPPKIEMLNSTDVSHSALYSIARILRIFVLHYIRQGYDLV